MLTRENVDQIFEEHNVYELDPEAGAQRLAVVVLAIGIARGEAQSREPRMEDGVFAGWGICLPLFRQPDSYTEFMRERRRELLGEVRGDDDAFSRGREFFPKTFLLLELDELGAMVSAENAVDQIRRYLEELPA